MNQDEPKQPGAAPGTPPEKTPWPMSRVLLAIVAFVVFYTLVMIYFRKETDMFYPYEEAQAEVLGILLRAEGWEPLPEAYIISEFRVSDEELGLREQEISTFDKEETIGLEIGEHSTTPLTLAAVRAPDTLAAGAPYQAEILWEVKEDGAYPQGLNFFIREREIIIFPPHGRIRAVENAVPATRFLIPPENLEPGEYLIFLYTGDGLRGWRTTVEE
jgi:hypothetical protein